MIGAEPMPTAKITSKGQVTIPKIVRERLDLKAGDKVDFILESDNRVVLRPAKLDVRDLKGMLYRPGRKPLSVEEMKRITRERAVRSAL